MSQGRFRLSIVAGAFNLLFVPRFGYEGPILVLPSLSDLISFARFVLLPFLGLALVEPGLLLFMDTLNFFSFLS